MNARPLEGKRILITREKSQAKSFAEQIEACGGEPIQIPLINIVCRHESIDPHHIKKYEWIFITSANGVHCFFQRLKEQEQLHLLKDCRLAVVGHKTEEALKAYGFTADFIPSVYNADTMAEEFRQAFPNAKRLLLVRGNQSRPTLPREFTKHGYEFAMLEVYETMTNTEAKEALNQVLGQGKLDFITFTSPSTVQAFFELVNPKFLDEQMVYVCIGTTTQAAAEAAGCKTILIPDVFTIEGMIETMKDYISKKG